MLRLWMVSYCYSHRLGELMLSSDIAGHGQFLLSPVNDTLVDMDRG